MESDYNAYGDIPPLPSERTPIPLRHQCSPVCRHSPLREHQTALRDSLEEQIALHQQRRRQKTYVSPKIGGRMYSPAVSTTVQPDIPVLKLRPELEHHRHHLVNADTRRERILRARALGDALKQQIEEAELRKRPPPPTPLMYARFQSQSPLRSYADAHGSSAIEEAMLPREADEGEPQHSGESPDQPQRSVRAATSMEMSAPIMQMYSGNFTTLTVGKRGRANNATPSLFHSVPDLRRQAPLLGGKPLFDLDAREVLEQQRKREAAFRTEQLKADLKREIEERERRRKAAEAREKRVELELEEKARKEALLFADDERRRQDEATKVAADTIETNKQMAEMQQTGPLPPPPKHGRRALPPLEAPTPQDLTLISDSSAARMHSVSNQDDILVALRDIKEELMEQRKKLSEFPPVRPHHPALFTPPPRNGPGAQLQVAKCNEEPGPFPYATERFVLRDTASDLLERNQTRLNALRHARDSNEILQAFLLQDANAALRSLGSTRLPPPSDAPPIFEGTSVTPKRLPW